MCKREECLRWHGGLASAIFAIDRRMSRLNYNANEVVTKLDNKWTQARVQWRPASGVAVRNVLYLPERPRVEERRGLFLQFHDGAHQSRSLLRIARRHAGGQPVRRQRKTSAGPTSVGMRQRTRSHCHAWRRLVLKLPPPQPFMPGTVSCRKSGLECRMCDLLVRRTNSPNSPASMRRANTLRSWAVC